MRVLRQLLFIISAISVLLTSSLSWADSGDNIKAKLASIGVMVSEVKPSEVDGLLELTTNQGVLFTTSDGEYFISGTLYHLSDDGNLTNVLAKRQAPINAKAIAEYRDDMIEYKADNEKYAVTVFTDITCGYCVKLHSQMSEYNALGITVRYLAFPRQGLNNEVANVMADIWCAEDPKKAMNDAKAHQKLPQPISDEACKSKVPNHYNLGHTLGVQGTPAIFLPDGSMLGGYLPPQTLLERLENL
ncbi:bifunctional protein-disulfide isomerase/oxidoreductase DsbC [Vibrio sp. RC27]